jgi:oxygen-independent coproporphyrinogen-3 oxidase
MKNLENLIQKYSGRTPRYNSYPTAVEFHSGIGNKDWLDALRENFFPSKEKSAEKKRIALYLHLPFCKTLCYFCACNKNIAQDYSPVSSYLKSLFAELNSYRWLGSNVEVEQFHWGGGTPNFLTPEDSKKVFQTCTAVFPKFSADADISVEVDPRTLLKEHLEVYRELGFNRISAGVQDFSEAVQVAVNRIQPHAMTKEMVDYARNIGFSSINMDLIYGLPEQTEESFRDTIDKVIDLAPERIALYGYAHVTWKKKVQTTFRRFDLPTPELRIKLFLIALEKLENAGYVYIGMDHFARPDDSLTLASKNGKLNRNFMGYSTHRGADVLGFGVSAVSSLRNIYVQNETDLEKYQNQVLQEEFAVCRGVKRSVDDQMRGEVIEEILCNGLVDFKNFSSNWNLDFNEVFADDLKSLNDMAADGLVELGSGKLVVTDLGKFFYRNIASVFDAYLSKHLESSKAVFSQSV